MESRETGKQRSQRIQIDYYRKRGGLFWMRWVCALVGLLGAAVYAAIVMGTADGNRHVSTGPLSVVHASFESDCRQCHKDFTPLASDAFQINKIDALQHTESACQSCHQVGDHHRSVMTAEWKSVDQNCSACHSDHLGRANDLTAITNRQCAQCHAKLDAVCMSTHSPTVKTDVANFTLASHGDFRSLAQGDSGRVKFDHKQHMLPGQVDQGQSGGFTMQMVEAGAREKYQSDANGNVTLDCSNCHLPSGNPASQSLLEADDELGRYMAPVSYDQHCVACHAINPPGRRESTLPLPHAAPWSEIELLLQAKIAGMRARGDARKPRDDTNPIPLPGVGLGSQRNDITIVSAAEVAQQRGQTQQQCLKCHDAESITDDAISNAIKGNAAPLVPPRWLKHGLYDHAAHQKIDCLYCHEAAYPSDQTKAAVASDHQTVMIGGIETCTSCHRGFDAKAPEQQPLWGGQPAWAADDCILCHRYHLGATP